MVFFSRPSVRASFSELLSSCFAFLGFLLVAIRGVYHITRVDYQAVAVSRLRALGNAVLFRQNIASTNRVEDE